MFFECFLFIVLGLTLISILFSNFFFFLLLLILFSLLILQYILIIGTISIISPNVLISIGLSIVYWITSIILVAIDKSKFGLIAPFEASNSMYMYIEDILTIFIFFILLFIINFVILLLSKKRWLKLGM